MKYVVEAPYPTVARIVSISRLGDFIPLAFAVVLSMIASVPIGCSRDTASPASDLQSIQVLPVNSSCLRYVEAFHRHGHVLRRQQTRRDQLK